MSSLPGMSASRSPFTRTAPTAPARDRTPTVSTAATSAAAAPFGALLGAILATNGEARAVTDAAAQRANDGGDNGAAADVFALLGDSNIASATMPTTTALSESDLQAAGLSATTMGAAGLAALTGQNDATAAASTTADGATATNGGTAASDTAAATDATAAAKPASPAAAAAIAAAAGTTRPLRELDAIAPELRERVERVVERMRDEFGIDVDITEGYRTQARQDMLHAQGRSAAGPVVTWTRNSRHTLGRAVDVTVNGGYSDRRGFATLQRVAREEGLHTLGMRDPGHLELPASVAGSARPTTAALAGGVTGAVDLAALAQLASDAGARVESLGVNVDVDLAPAPSTTTRAGGAAAATVATAQTVGGMARVAPVATVATVAQVATVARVARVAVPGTGSAGRGSGAGDSGTAVASRSTAAGRAATAAAATTAEAAAVSAASEVRTTAATATATQSATGAAGPVAAAQVAAANGQATPRQRAESAADERAGEVVEAGAGGVDSGALFGGEGSRDRGGSIAAPRMAPITGTLAADALTRLDQIDALRDGSASRPLSHLTLTLDNAAGGSDRIRVDVRGSQMGAVLELSDPVLRDRVSSHLGELQHALEQRGLQSDALQVRRAGVGATETLDMSRIAGATLERETVRAGSNANSGQSSTQQRERDGRQPSDGPPDDSSPRHRSRREPKENHK